MNPIRAIKRSINRLRGEARVNGIALPIDRSVLSPHMELTLAAGRYERRERALSARIIRPGDVVQLKSGERAVVLRRGATVGTPLVAAITNRSGMPIVQTVRRDTSRSEFAIAGAVRDQRFVLRMPPERLFGLPM